MIDRTSDRALSPIAAWLTHNIPSTPAPAPAPSAAPSSFSGARSASVLPSRSDDVEDELNAPLPKWEHELLDVPYPRLFEVMIAANYLGMERLGRQAAQVVGERLRGLTAVQMRRVLCIEEEKMSDFHEARAGWVRSRGEEEEGRQAREEERREQEGEERGYDSE